jgi:hypothetical protein
MCVEKSLLAGRDLLHHLEDRVLKDLQCCVPGLKCENKVSLKDCVTRCLLPVSSCKNSLPTTDVEFPCSGKGWESYLDIVLAEAEVLAWVYLSWQRLGFLPGYTCPGRG